VVLQADGGNRKLDQGGGSKKVNFILDADIRSFFTEVSQEWVVRFLEHRIGDTCILRLVQKWLRAGRRDRDDRGEGDRARPCRAEIFLVSRARARETKKINSTNASGPKIEAAVATRTAASAIRVAYNE
jgi:hypothetical protein